VVSRRDGKARLPWSVKGVSPDARDFAKAATSRDGETMGEWLSDVIRRVGAAQAAGRPLAPPHRRGVPVVPGRAATPAAAVTPAMSSSDPEPRALNDADTVDEAAVAALVADRIERTEARLVGLLGTLEDIVLRLSDRLERLERRVEDIDRDDPPSFPPR